MVSGYKFWKSLPPLSKLLNPSIGTRHRDKQANKLLTEFVMKFRRNFQNFKGGSCYLIFFHLGRSKEFIS